MRTQTITTFFLFLAVQSLFAQKITRGPYLQAGSSASIVVRWRTDSPTDSKVSFGLANNQLNRQVLDGAPTTEHEINLADLQPNTVYFYNVGSTTALQGGGTDYYFKTAPTVGSKQKIRIWAMGDMGNGSPNQRAVRDAYLRDIKKDNRQTDVVMMLGDNAYASGTDLEYQNSFFDFYQDFFMKNNVVWSVPGNHEYYAINRNSREIPYFKIFTFPQNGEAGGVPSGTEMYYSFNYGNVHFVALDSDGIEDGRFRLSDTLGRQVQWLKNDLAANRQPWTIVQFHHPPFTKNSHDSDQEFELSELRRNLTPILERFKVDLVFSAHSHLYERSRPMRGHQGFSDSFNASTHLTDTKSGRYDGSPNGCAYVKDDKNDGVIYLVVGSSGQNNGREGPAHPAMPFKNARDGGSMVLEVEDNRLDARFLCFDGVVRDNFTIFKNVNKTSTIKAQHGETVRLTPSWKGTYAWQNGTRQRELTFVLLGDTTISVRDSLGCLEDRFTVQLTARPNITINFAKPTMCLGERVSVPFALVNTDADRWQYSLQLSDSRGNFNSPITLATVTKSPFEVTIPANLGAGEGYRFRVVANVRGIESVLTSTFAVRTKATATLSGQTTIDAGNATNLTLNFTGSGPWTYRLSDNTTSVTTSNNPTIISVNPLITTTYSLNELNNVCGAGSGQGAARVVVVPRLEADVATSQTICNSTELNINFVQTGLFETRTNYVAQLSDARGGFSAPRTLGVAAQSPVKITIPTDVGFGDNYQVRVVPETNATAKIVLSKAFVIQQRATATLSGQATIDAGNTTNLTLNFTGSGPWTYRLSDNTTSVTTSNNPTIISVNPLITTTYSLNELNNVCGAGSGQGAARVVVVPRLEATVPANAVVCNGTEISVSFVQTGLFETRTNYLAQLSDARGGFSAPRSLGVAAQSPLQASIPTDVGFGENYQIRVVPETNATAKIVLSKAFAVQQRATAVLSGDTTISFGAKTNLVLRFAGTAPWTYVLSDNGTASASVSPLFVPVGPESTTIYALKSVNNVCGNGTVSGTAKVNILITALEAEDLSNLKIFPNPAHNRLMVEINALQSQSLNWELLDLNGKTVVDGHLRRQNHNHFEIDLSNLPVGSYVLKMTANGQKMTRKVIKF